MQIIPVIDLKGGLAVHAKEGHREHYRPLVSTLCAHPTPHEVVRGLLKFHPFSTLYLADLDALTGHQPQTELIAALISSFPGTEFWVDQGLMPADAALPEKSGHFSRVIGSESLQDDNLSMLAEQSESFILSLDFMNEGLMGATRVLEHPENWPKRIILMSLAHVGSQRGPDFKRISHYLEHFPDRHFMAAGGVRHEADLHELARLGVSGVLMASALHDGRVESGMIERLTGVTEINEPLGE